VEYHSKTWRNGASTSFVHFWHADHNSRAPSLHFGYIEQLVAVISNNNPEQQFMVAKICTHRAVPQQKEPLLTLASLSATARRSYILVPAIAGAATCITNAHLNGIPDPRQPVMAVVFL
jgi:hypothetical protein